jgi:hypothetical protein
MISSVIISALLTVAIEVPFLLLTVCRSKTFAVAAVLANLATNLTLNLVVYTLVFTFRFDDSMWLIIYPLEMLVVCVEYAVYRIVLQPSWRLLILTLAANVFSYVIGVLIYGHI